MFSCLKWGLRWLCVAAEVQPYQARRQSVYALVFFPEFAKMDSASFPFCIYSASFPASTGFRLPKGLRWFWKIFKLHSDIQLTCLALIRCGRSAFSQWKSTIFQPFTCRTWGTQVTQTDSDRIQGASYRTWSVEVRDLQLSLCSFSMCFPSFTFLDHVSFVSFCFSMKGLEGLSIDPVA